MSNEAGHWHFVSFSFVSVAQSEQMRVGKWGGGGGGGWYRARSSSCSPTTAQSRSLFGYVECGDSVLVCELAHASEHVSACLSPCLCLWACTC